MAKVVKPLTDTQIKSFKPKEKDYVESDGNGLYLKITPAGLKMWFYRYISPITSKERKTNIGKYPDYSLKMAREEREKLSSIIAEGKDPQVEKQKIEEEKKNILKEEEGTNFIELMEKYLEIRQSHKSLTNRTMSDMRKKLNNHIYPYLPKKEKTLLKDVNYDLLIECLTRLEKKDNLETLKKIKGYLINFYKYLFSEQILKDNMIITSLEVKTFKKRHRNDVINHGTFTSDEELIELLKNIYSYNGMNVTKLAILMTFHLALRQDSLIKGEWNEIDESNRVWNIPASRMKNKKNFTIPLSDEVMSLLHQLREINSHSKYIFANPYNNKPINTDSVTNAFRKMGYEKGTITAHGLRTTFSTIANENISEHKIRPEYIEKVLSHKVGTDVSLVYNKAENLEEMKKLLDWWSSYIKRLEDLI